MAKFQSSVLKRLSRKDAFSSSRRSYLQKFANLIVMPDVRVGFDQLPNPACCTYEGSHYRIKIDQTPYSRRRNQVNGNPELGELDSVSDGYVDAFLQEGLLFHELGHVLFSDYDALRDVLGDTRMSLRDELSKFINVFEDAVIELFLRQYYDCHTQLLVKNKVFHELYSKNSKLWQDPKYCKPLTQATLPAYELGRYDTGALENLDLSAVDEGIEIFYEVIQLPEARERYEYLSTKFEELRSPTQATDELEELLENEADEMVDGEGQQESPAEIKPPEDEEEEQDEQDEQDESGNSVSSDEGGEEEDESGGGGGSSEEGGDEDEDGTGGSSESEDEDSEDEEESGSEDGDDGESSFVGDLSEEDVEELEEETELSPEDGSDQDAEQVEEELSVAGIGAGQGPGKIKEYNASNFTAPDDLLDLAERRSRHLSRTIRDHFEPRKGRAERSGLTSGRFDSRQMIDAARGSPRVFKKEDNPDEPDFQVVVLLDESGSMSNGPIEKAASAAVSVVKAFEDAGGQVYFYRFAASVGLVKTPSVGYEDVREAVGSLKTGGGTSLLPALKQYSEITDMADNSFLFVITDGCPANDKECRDELESMKDPTACLQINSSGYGFKQNYDAFATVEDEGEIQNKTESLLRRLVETGGSSL